MLIAQLTRTAEDSSHPERFDLRDTQGVAGLEQPPGRRRGVGLNTAMLNEDGCRTERRGAPGGGVAAYLAKVEFGSEALPATWLAAPPDVMIE